MSVSAVLPAYNEEAIIERTVRHVADVLSGLVDDFEVVVTNDGSVDGTGDVLRRLQQDRSVRLRIVTHEQNRGYGAALASGFDAATKDLVFMTDGDKQFDVREIDGFLTMMREDTDLAIGWRRDRADPPMRLLNAWGWKRLVNGLFGYTARDIDCAFKLFRREVWTNVAVQARGATFSAELLIKARRRGFRVTELPVSHFPRTNGSATGARLSVIVRAFWELFQLWRTLDRQLANGGGVPAARRTTALSRS
jgi:glycosyltransferase involved in cell wall biosynthesis